MLFRSREATFVNGALEPVLHRRGRRDRRASPWHGRRAPVLKFDAGRPFLYRLVSKGDFCQSFKRRHPPLLYRLVPTHTGAFGSKLGSKNSRSSRRKRSAAPAKYRCHRPCHFGSADQRARASCMAQRPTGGRLDGDGTALLTEQQLARLGRIVNAVPG